MGDKSKIEWTDATWNVATGCTKVSSGCAHCYAEDVARRSWKERPFEDVRFHADRLTQPLRWTRPRRIFVNSLSDLFHPTITDGQIMQALDVMAQARHHTFQILTKRPKRMQEFFAKWLDLTGENLNEPKLVQGPEAVRKTHPSGRGQLFANMLDAMGDPPPGTAVPFFDWMDGMINWDRIPENIWLSVSTENHSTATERVPVLLDIPAKVRFVSAEPILEMIDFENLPGRENKSTINSLTGVRTAADGTTSAAGDHINWVIVGGESGPKARPCPLLAIDHIVKQCQTSGVPVFVKQLGRRPAGSPMPTGPTGARGENIECFPPGLRLREYPR